EVSPEENVQLGEAMTGFALATLEFIAYAARDEHLKAEMAKRMGALTQLYTGMAEEARAADDLLSAEDLGLLLTAVDQGAGLLVLAGGVDLDPGVLRAGLQRLLDPTGARGEAVATSAEEGEQLGGLHDAELRRRFAEALRDDEPE